MTGPIKLEVTNRWSGKVQFTAEIDCDESASYSVKVCREPAHEPGKLDGYGICVDCGENYSACVGLYYCPFCSGEM